MFKNYMIKPEYIQAVKISLQNIEDVANSVGGDITVEDGMMVLHFPTLHAVKGLIGIGDYLVKESNGRLHSMSSDYFDKKYKEEEYKYIIR